MGQELLGLYFIVCFNKIEHFIRDSACNYVRNAAQWEHYTSTRALELICPAPHHWPHQSHLMDVIVIISLVISGLSMEISSRLQQVDSYWPFWSLLMWLLKWVFVLLNTTGHYQTSLTSPVWDVGQPQFEYHNSDPLMLSLSALEMNFNISWQNDYIV